MNTFTHLSKSALIFYELVMCLLVVLPTSGCRSQPEKQASVENVYQVQQQAVAIAPERIFPANYARLSPNEQQVIVKQAIAILPHATDLQRIRLCKQLSEAGQVAWPLLDDASKDPDFNVRLYATLAKYEVDWKHKADFIEKALLLRDSTNPFIIGQLARDIRAYSVFISGVYPALIKSAFLPALSESLRADVLISLGLADVEDAEVANGVMTFLNAPKAEVRTAAAFALSHLQPKIDLYKRVLLNELQSDDRDTKLVTMEMLGDMRQEAAIAIKALIRIMNEEPDYETFIDIFEYDIESSELPLGAHAARALAKIGIPNLTSRYALHRLLLGRDIGLKYYALYALAEQGQIDGYTAEILLRVLKDRNYYISSVAAYLLGNIDPNATAHKRVLPELISCLYHHNTVMKLACASALRSFDLNYKEKINALLDQIDTGEPYLTVQMLISLVETIRSNRDARDYFERRVERVDPESRSVVFLILLMYFEPEMRELLTNMEATYHYLITEWDIEQKYAPLAGEFEGELRSEDGQIYPITLRFFTFGSRSYGNYSIMLENDREVNGSLFDYKVSNGSQVFFRFFDNGGKYGRLNFQINLEDFSISGTYYSSREFSNARLSARLVKRGQGRNAVMVEQIQASADEDEPKAEIGGDESDASGCRHPDLDLLEEVLSHIGKDYYDPFRIDYPRMLESALNAFAEHAAPVILTVDELNEQIQVTVNGNVQTFFYSAPSSGWGVQCALSEIYEFALPQINGQVDHDALEKDVVKAVLSTVDPHSNYLPDWMFRSFDESAKGERFGLGIAVAIDEGNLVVEDVMEGSPADLAGLKTGDRIMAIDGKSTQMMSLKKAFKLLRGDLGSRVRVSVSRKGWRANRTIAVQRDYLRPPTVRSALLKDSVGYVKISEFQYGTARDLKEALAGMQRSVPLNGLILDLRGNPGGLLGAALSVADLFIEKDDLAHTTGADGKAQVTFEADLVGTEGNYPIAVLVDGWSASASELVSGALQQQNRAVIIGEPTFGKGSVQRIYSLENGEGLKITTSQYALPGLKSIQVSGVQPEISVQAARFDKDGIRLATRPDGLHEAELDYHVIANVEQVEGGTGASVIYVHDDKRDKEDPENPLQINTGHFLVTFARDLLVNMKSSQSREDMLLGGRTFVEQVASQQLQQVIAQFRQRGIDWLPTPPDMATDAAQAPRLTVNVESKPELDRGRRVTVTVVNLCERSVGHLRAVSRSENPALDKLEFFFGLLKPGEAKQYTVRLEPKIACEGRADEMTLAFSSDCPKPPEPVTLVVETPSSAHPELAYTYQLAEANGKGDGLLQTGELMELTVTIRNIGTVATDDGEVVLVSPKYDDRVYLHTSKTTFKSLAPGKEFTAHMRFVVEKEFTQSEVPLVLVVYDGKRDLWLMERLEFALAPALEFKPVGNNQKLVVAKGVRIYASPDATQPPVHVLSEDATLKVLASCDGWSRVALAGGRVGYVATDAPLASKAKAGTPAIDFFRAPPRVMLGENCRTRSVRKAAFVLEGVAQSDLSLMDLFVRVNGRKVYYQSNDSGADKMSLAFSVALELEPGVNHIEVVARERKGFYRTESAYVYFQEPEEKAGEPEAAQESAVRD